MVPLNIYIRHKFDKFGRRQAIIWTNARILLIEPLKMSSAKWRPFCLGLNVLNAGRSGYILIHMTSYKHLLHNSDILSDAISIPFVN